MDDLTVCDSLQPFTAHIVSTLHEVLVVTEVCIVLALTDCVGTVVLRI